MKVKIKALTQLSVDGNIVREGETVIIERSEAQINECVQGELYEVVEHIDAQSLLVAAASKGGKDK